MSQKGVSINQKDTIIRRPGIKKIEEAVKSSNKIKTNTFIASNLVFGNPASLEGVSKEIISFNLNGSQVMISSLLTISGYQVNPLTILRSKGRLFKDCLHTKRENHRARDINHRSQKEVIVIVQEISAKSQDRSILVRNFVRAVLTTAEVTELIHLFQTEAVRGIGFRVADQNRVLLAILIHPIVFLRRKFRLFGFSEFLHSFRN